jgi:L-iditol 2-dehydrogenase
MIALLKQSYDAYDAALRTMPDPEPGPGDVVIKVQAAGICGTDMKIYHGQYKPYKTPVVMGHELSGTIAALGKEVENLCVGMPVTSRTIVTSCGRCPLCIKGRENLCRAKTRIGFDYDGAFAQFIKVRQDQVHVLPPGLDASVAVLCEVFAVVIHGLQPVMIKPTDTVLVMGPGPIGLVATILAKTNGATVAVAGLPADSARLALAKEVGADFTVCGGEQDPGLQELMDTTGGLGPNVVLECSGTAGGVTQGLNLCRAGGRYVQIGTQNSPVTVDFMRIAYKELEVTGTIGHTKLDWQQTIPFVAKNQEHIRPLLRNSYSLQDWKEAFSVAEGKEAAKVVLLPPQA